MSEISEIKRPIQEAMDKFEVHFKSSIKSQVPLLDIITNYILRRKGKQMRPMLVFLSAKITGEIQEKTYVAASLIELLHTATLIHDDVVDEAYERRGYFSLNALWKSKIAVLMGDYMLAQGLLLSVHNKSYELLEIVSHAVKEMSEGELLQLKRSRTLNISRDEYFEIIRKKTATLISACSAAGTKSSGASDEAVEIMKSFGTNLGMAFQIKDDLFDYKPKGLIGKPTGNDIKEKKFTLPLIYSLEQSTPQEKREVMKMINRSGNSNNLTKIIDFVTAKGGIQFSEKTMEAYKNKALEDLRNFPPSEARSSMEMLVEYTINRDK